MRKGYTFHSREEKLEVVKRYLSGGETALENQRKLGNPLSKYSSRKALSREEQLEYQVELLNGNF